MFPYRDDNPTKGFPIFTLLLIAVNIGVMILLGFNPDYDLIVKKFGFLPSEPRPITYVTSMFLHGGLGHLVFNMWYLWLFGDNVEDALGRFRFLLFYLLGGVI